MTAPTDEEIIEWLKRSAARALDYYSEDELEEFAEAQRKKDRERGKENK